MKESCLNILCNILVRSSCFFSLKFVLRNHLKDSNNQVSRQSAPVQMYKSTLKNLFLGIQRVLATLREIPQRVAVPSLSERVASIP
jgi:hypothetical protein